MPATYTSPVAKSPVICTLRMKGLARAQLSLGVQVAPLSVEKRTLMARAREQQSCSRKRTSVRRMEMTGLLSAQPDSRSSLEPV